MFSVKKMIEHKYYIIFICTIFLLSVGIKEAAGDEYTKNIEVVKAEISIDHEHLPQVAYLYVTLKNNGDKKVSNLTLRISYYDEDNYLIKKAILKKVLNDNIPQGETRKYKVRLRGDFVNERNEQYPYSQDEKIYNFDVEILSVQLALW